MLLQGGINTGMYDKQLTAAGAVGVTKGAKLYATAKVLRSLELMPSHTPPAPAVSCMLAFQLGSQLLPLQQQVQLKTDLNAGHNSYHVIGLRGFSSLLKLSKVSGCWRWMPKAQEGANASGADCMPGLLVISLEIDPGIACNIHSRKGGASGKAGTAADPSGGDTSVAGVLHNQLYRQGNAPCNDEKQEMGGNRQSFEEESAKGSHQPLQQGQTTAPAATLPVKRKAGAGRGAKAGGGSGRAGHASGREDGSHEPAQKRCKGVNQAFDQATTAARGEQVQEASGTASLAVGRYKNTLMHVCSQTILQASNHHLQPSSPPLHVHLQLLLQQCSHLMPMLMRKDSRLVLHSKSRCTHPQSQAVPGTPDAEVHSYSNY
jgi:hypothetical protein